MTPDLAAIDKRIAELRADDAAMNSPEPACTCTGSFVYGRHDTRCARYHHEHALLDAKARTRNSLASTADMLQQLRDEVERMRPLVQAALNSNISWMDLDDAVDAYRAARDKAGG